MSRLPLLYLILACWSSVLTAEPQTTPAPAEVEASAEVDAPAVEAISVQERLLGIRQQALEKRKELDELHLALKKEKNEELLAEIKQRQAELHKALDSLNRAFEQIATGGVSLQSLSDKPEAPFDWKSELVLITKPLFSSLRDLTEKPRKIENLRMQVEQQIQRLELIDRAMASIAGMQKKAPETIVNERLGHLSDIWGERREETLHELEFNRYELARLQGESETTWDALSVSMLDFLSGRGLTLAIAIISLLAVWLLMRLLLSIARRLSPKKLVGQKRRTHERAMRYLHRGVTGLLMMVALLSVFYARSDLFLLALTLIASMLLLMSLRQAMPKYMGEIRTLLDFGSVRIHERILMDGVAFQVQEISTFAYLKNPLLDGVVRLPLAGLSDLCSRPDSGDDWFPCQPGDLLLLDDGRFVQVEQQSVERVRLLIARSPLEMATTDFIKLEFRNLSRQGYLLLLVFGIDYQHQAIVLDEVPQKMEAALQQALSASDHAEHLLQLQVEFREAAVNSLDFHIAVHMAGGAASSYGAIQRLVQRTLVDLCNRQNWVIPFAQIQIHQSP
jgi:hypothetical protein